eukprot:4843978-Alexandrium_andersonii.AAC.1
MDLFRARCSPAAFYSVGRCVQGQSRAASISPLANLLQGPPRAAAGNVPGCEVGFDLSMVGDCSGEGVPVSGCAGGGTLALPAPQG